MKIECYKCGKEFDKDSDDIICKVVGESLSAIFYGFVCRDCKNKEINAKKLKEEQRKDAQKQRDEEAKNRKWWQL